MVVCFTRWLGLLMLGLPSLEARLIGVEMTGHRGLVQLQKECVKAVAQVLQEEFPKEKDVKKVLRVAWGFHTTLVYIDLLKKQFLDKSDNKYEPYISECLNKSRDFVWGQKALCRIQDVAFFGAHSEYLVAKLYDINNILRLTRNRILTELKQLRSRNGLAAEAFGLQTNDMFPYSPHVALLSIHPAWLKEVVRKYRRNIQSDDDVEKLITKVKQKALRRLEGVIDRVEQVISYKSFQVYRKTLGFTSPNSRDVYTSFPLIQKR